MQVVGSYRQSLRCVRLDDTLGAPRVGLLRYFRVNATSYTYNYSNICYVVERRTNGNISIVLHKSFYASETTAAGFRTI
jgi:hypothetical protein